MLPMSLIKYIQRSKLTRLVPSKLRPLLRGLASLTYAERVAQEQAIFEGQEQVHDLPPIFHYWSNTWLRPQLEALGFSDPDAFFFEQLKKALQEHPDGARFASLGAGNCDTEVRIARRLVDQGLDRFTLECVDINPTMLERGRALARESGVEAQVLPVQGDFNAWRPDRRYDAIMANQSLHHVLALENLFTAVDTALVPHGRFIVSDMIGRNGHMRWPEAMDIIHEYWRELPPGYRWNVQLRRHEELLDYWDCSKEGFEGIRAQDILPLLIARFDFELFFAYGNLIDPFIDRSFGPHFDADSATDRALIDRIHRRDVEEIAAGRIKPTHLIASMRKRPYTGERVHLPGITPETSVRPVDGRAHA